MFQVLFHRAIHEGGTKFYQQVKIDHPASGMCFLIQHWGPWPRTGFDISGGQRKILKTTRVNGDWEYREKLQAKTIKKKPGDKYKTSDTRTVSVASLSELREFVRNDLGGTVSQAMQISDYFGFFMPAKESEIAGEVIVPITVKSSGDIPVTEGWGSW